MPKLITPMSPILYPEIFNDPKFIYQVKWDGVRMISYLESSVNLINKRLNDRTKQYPELQILNKLVKKPAILDGEIITLINGKPSFPAIIRRDSATKERNISLLQKKIPVLYMVFDILQLNGENLCNLPWYKRNEILNNTVIPHEHVHIVDSFSQGISLFDAVKSQELEGVVAKQRESPYVSGKRHSYWLKIKYRRKISCVVGGFTLRNNIINSLLAGVYHEGKLIYIGRVGTGLKYADWQLLTEELFKIETPDSPFSSLPSRELKKAHFVKTYFTIEVEYAEWTPDMHLRSPTIIGFSNKSPADCTLD